MIAAGTLDRRATLQSPVVTRSTSGDAMTGWATVATVWAGKRDLRGRELTAAAATIAEHETTIAIRWRADVRPSWRVQMDGRTYDIQAAAEVGRREGLELRCIAAVDA